MACKKNHDISYFDLKDVCKILNQHEHLLGARITIHKKGFNDLMESFIKAVVAVPCDRREDIPEEVWAFYNNLPREWIVAGHVAAPPEKTVALADDGVPELEPRPAPLKEGRIKIKTTVGLTEAVRHLEDLLAALKKRRIFIESRSKAIMMKPGGSVKIKIEAEVRKGKKSSEEQLAVKLEWQRFPALDLNVNDYGISIMKER
jgi:amphi-Trp domain-containing protein